ncbi:MAG: hypothetical protein ACH37Z_01215 [Anaerolineae bacterium]
MLMPLTVLLHCDFVEQMTPPTMAYVAALLAGSVVGILVLRRFLDQLPARLGIMALGVLIFEMFTAPMWLNERLGRFAYVYHDVSWVMLLAWSVALLAIATFVDRRWPAARAWRSFAITLAIFTPLAVLEELAAVRLGIRSYAEELLQAVSGAQIGHVPAEIVYYTPVFGALVLAFYRLWSLVLEDRALIPVKRRYWLRATALTALGVLLFEVMTEPMVRNVGFPAWSVFFHDINVILLGFWVLAIGAAAVTVQLALPEAPIPARFLAGMAVVTAVVLPVEAWLMRHGYRVYGESAAANFTGYKLAFLDVPVEVAVAIPFYAALIIAFVRYWETVMDNEL